MDPFTFLDASGIKIARTASLRESDTVSHFGGNEFVILLPELASSEEGLTIVAKVMHALDDHIAIFGRHVEITSSVGIALYPAKGGDSAAGLLKKAEIAMCNVKATGRNNYSIYSQEAGGGNRAGLH